MPTYGYIPDHAEIREGRPHIDLAGSPPSGDELDLRPIWRTLDPTHLFQIKSNSCVLQSIANGARVLWAANGQEAPIISRRAGYYWARSYEGGPIADTGCRTAYALRAYNEYGCIREEAFPFDEDNIDEPPPGHIYRDAYDAEHALDTYRCDTGNDLRTAFGHRFPGLVGLTVDKSFEQWTGGDPWRFSGGDATGLHMMMTLAYSLDMDAFWAVHSWFGYGDTEGGIWIARSEIDSSRCVDKIALRRVPHPRRMS